MAYSESGGRVRNKSSSLALFHVLFPCLDLVPSIPCLEPQTREWTDSVTLNPLLSSTSTQQVGTISHHSSTLVFIPALSVADL